MFNLGEKPPLEDAKPFKIRTVPVCKCGDSKENCATCGEGYLEVTLKGEIPHFKEEKVEVKKIPVCDCGEEMEECSTCHRGYLEAAKAGLIPKFKEVEVSDSKDKPKAEDKQAPGKEEEKEATTGLMKLVGLGLESPVRY